MELKMTMRNGRRTAALKTRTLLPPSIHNVEEQEINMQERCREEMDSPIAPLQHPQRRARVSDEVRFRYGNKM
jgi:hypothetical protein